MKLTLTQAQVKSELRALGVSFSRKADTNEFLVGGTYYTDCLQDALDTGKHIAMTKANQQNNKQHRKHTTMATIKKNTQAATPAATPTAAATPAKPAATPAAKPAATKVAADPKAAGGIDISKLTPDQLAALQKQLKATKKVDSGKTKERFAIIDAMLQEKDEDSGEFKHTTRDILNKLVGEELVKAPTSADEQNEIKKIQARKQHLSKLRDKAGKLVHAEGTFGYKQSSALGFKMTAAKAAEWFTAENVATMTQAQKDAVVKALTA